MNYQGQENQLNGLFYDQQNSQYGSVGQVHFSRNGALNGQYENSDMMVDSNSDYHSADYLSNNRYQTNLNQTVPYVGNNLEAIINPSNWNSEPNLKKSVDPFQRDINGNIDFKSFLKQNTQNNIGQIVDPQLQGNNIQQFTQNQNMLQQIQNQKAFNGNNLNRDFQVLQNSNDSNSQLFNLLQDNNQFLEEQRQTKNGQLQQQQQIQQSSYPNLNTKNLQYIDGVQKLSTGAYSSMKADNNSLQTVSEEYPNYQFLHQNHIIQNNYKVQDRIDTPQNSFTATGGVSPKSSQQNQRLSDFSKQFSQNTSQQDINVVQNQIDNSSSGMPDAHITNLNDRPTHPREKKPQQNVYELQDLLVQYRGLQRAERAQHWSQKQSVQENSQVGNRLNLTDPTAMSMAIITAPAAMALPCKPNKLFHPPYKVRVYMGYNTELCFVCKVTAYVLCEQQVENLHLWFPDSHNFGEGFDNDAVEHTFQLTQDEILSQHQAARQSQNNENKMLQLDFEFVDMRFMSPSRMKKRWIVFCCNCPNGDQLYCYYKVPTVVVSRSIDQYNKALLILQGIVPKDGRSMRGRVRDCFRSDKYQNNGQPEYINKQLFREYIVRTYTQAGLQQRQLNEDDMEALEELVGFKNKPQQNLMRNDFDQMGKQFGQDLEMQQNQNQQSACISIDSQEFQSFELWWDSCLQMLRNVAHLWKSINPTIICGFGIVREKANHLLNEKPPETFLIRISNTRAGCFVISRRVKDGGSGVDQVKHAVLHSSDLHARAMETWIRDMQGVSSLLDIYSLAVVPKKCIFLAGYQRMVQRSVIGNGPQVEQYGQMGGQKLNPYQ